MNPVNRQDVQNIVEIARNRIMERMVTKQDILALTDTVKNLSALQLQSQQLLRQGEYQRSQLSRRVVALEARTIALENEIRSLNSSLSRMVGQRPQQIIMPVQNQPDERAMQQAAQYAEYRNA